MQNSFLEQIGERVQYLRESRDCSCGRLARRCGVDVSYICKIEKGAMKVTYSLYEDICIELRYSIADLFDGIRWVYTPPKAKGTDINERQGKVA